MVASLPPNIQLKLEQTLSQWQHWRGETLLPHRPKIISRFDSGLSNYSILVEAGQRFVVRINGGSSTVNRLSPTIEWSVLLSAHAASLAPFPRYFNPELGALVCDFLPQDIAEERNIDTTAALLRSIHTLPRVHHRLDLTARIVHYKRQMKQRGIKQPQLASDSTEDILRLISMLAQTNEASVLCHNDLLAANRIHSGGTLRAIDWEYCAMGSPWFDLAAIAVGDGLENAQIEMLLDSYLGQRANTEQTTRVQQYCIVYQYLEILWYLVNKPGTAGLGRKIANLQTMLSNTDLI